MRFSWSDSKRQLNLQQHGLDFVDAPRVFDGPTYTYEDDRFDYSEQRFVTLAARGAGCLDRSYRDDSPHPHYLFP
jgi:uncharacterized DUF497 family protein